MDSEARPMKDETFGEYRYKKAEKWEGSSKCLRANLMGVVLW